MGFTAFITEKPSVAQEYRKVLQLQVKNKTDGYIEGYSPVLKKDVKVTWAVGHLIGIGSVDEQRAGKRLPKGTKPAPWRKDNLPILPNDWVYTENGNTYAQYQVVKSIYTDKNLDAIYYAGDSGREGIYIQALIRNQIFKGKDPKCDERVVWIDSQTEESILNGIKTAKPYSHYLPMIESGYQRGRTDWLIGMNFTEAFTLTSGGLMNVGRVMTPTLAMVVERQKEIDNFVEQDYYGIKNSVNKAIWKATEKSKYYNSDKLFNDTGFIKHADAEALIMELNKNNSFTVEKVDSKKKTEYAPYLFNLADLQNHCSKAYHLSPSQTLNIVQSLYEKKLTTYPRTDARVLSSAVADEIKAKLGTPIPKKYVDDSKITDHYAIIPTDYKCKQPSVSLSDLEAKVYNDIVLRFKATFYPPYEYNTVNVTYLCPNGERFYESLKVVEKLGFRKLYGEEIDNPNIPTVNTVYNNVTFMEKASKTTPPPYYTTGTLITAMERAGKLVEDEELRDMIKTCGIGTSATRSNIIDKLNANEFIHIEKSQKVTATAKGMATIPIIAKFDENLVSPTKTAEMEQKLSDIADKKMSVSEYENYVRDYITATVSNVLNNNNERLSSGNAKADSGHAYDCPCCSKVLKYGKFGYYCDKNDDGCGFSFGNEICGHKMKESDLKDLIEKGQTKEYNFKSSKGNLFKASLKVDKDEHKTVFEFSKQKSSYPSAYHKMQNRNKSRDDYER